MKTTYTQTECKAIWESIKNNRPTLDEIDDIDAKTPWSNTEPKWWMEMMDFRRNLLSDKMKRII